MEFTIYDDDDVAPFLEGLEERPQRKVCVLDANKEAVERQCFVVFDLWYLTCNIPLYSSRVSEMWF